MGSFLTDAVDRAIGEISDTKDREVLVKYFKKLGPALDKAVEDAVASAHNGARPMRDHDVKYQNMLTAFRNNGYLPGRAGRISLGDMIQRDVQRGRDFEAGKLKPEDFAGKGQDEAFYWNNPFLLPRVISNIVREPMEPLMVLKDLFTPVRFDSPLQSILVTAISTVGAGPLDMTEGDPYPEITSPEYAGAVTATMGQVGISARISESMRKYSQYDLMAMHLRACGVALARWKEKKAANNLLAWGETFRDNSDASVALHTTGRARDGRFNGSLCLQDLHNGYADFMADGFIPNTLIVHPMFWTVMASDPVMRNWAYALGPKQLWQRHQGDVGAVQAWSGAGQTNGLMHNTFMHDPTQIQTTMTPLPPGLFPYPLNMIVSPYIPYDPTTNTTTVVMCDRSEVGLLCINEEPNTAEWRNPETEIEKVRIRERYGFAVMNEGKAIRYFKNVILTRAFDYEDKMTWDAATADLPTAEAFDL